MRLITTLISLLALSTVSSLGQLRTEYISKIKDTPSLVIPEEARRSGIGGEMYVWVNLDRDGNVTEVKSVMGPGPVCANATRADVTALRQAATEAAKLATFEPMIESGKRHLSSGGVRFDLPSGQPDPEEQVLQLGQLAAPGPGGSDNYLKRNRINLPKPAYPAPARAVRASGPVSVNLLIDEGGDVFTAQAISGNPLLRAAAVEAACRAKFRSTVVAGKPVKVSGVIIYNFVP